MTHTDSYHFQYARPSTAEAAPGGTTLALATCDGAGGHPWLAEGFAEFPAVVAAAVLSVGTVAATRFWTPPAMVARAILLSDPVVTTDAQVIRFESFSQCGGVYARFDLDQAAFDGAIHHHGTTNVDCGPDLRAQLSRLGARGPLALRIGNDQIEVETLSGPVVERKVPLPERWVRGFAECAVSASRLAPRFTLNAGALRRFLATIPTTISHDPAWVIAAGTSARITMRRPSAASAHAGASGLNRLRGLRLLASHATALTVYASPNGSADSSLWMLTVPGGRFTYLLSPGPSRGFSGEGQLWSALAAGGDEAAAVEAAASGRAGYDAASTAWFSRHLPYDLAALAQPGNRLDNARLLLAQGAVNIDGTDRATVTSGANTYLLRRTDAEWSCTCPWWGRHRGDRGPCKHALAVHLAATGDET